MLWPDITMFMVTLIKGLKIKWANPKTELIGQDGNAINS